ncbi:MAG: O-antigen ligase [Limisphaerales bacterium]
MYFSYTRSSWISLVVALVGYFLIKKNLLKEATIIGVIIVFASSGYLLQNNRYLDYAPDFSKTIYHDDFSDHMAATTSLEDVSSAERIYRWVAGWYMFTDKPITGFGPGNFFPHYQNYTVSSFYTYISRNEEQSTIHNYYLLSMVESGLIGSLLFWALIITALFRVQAAYQKQTSREGKNLAVALAVSLITILVNLFFSDLLEADKIGTMFYALLALIIVLDRKKSTQKLN